MILYHGSISGLKLPIKVDYSSNPCDFGKGFYLGDMKEQAQNRVCNFRDSVVYEMELDMNKYRTYQFEDDVLWALFIGVNRKRIELSEYKKLTDFFDKLHRDYDILIGHIADDKIAQSFNRFMDGDITDRALTECLREVKYGNQYVIKKQNVANDIVILNEYLYDDKERLYLRRDDPRL